MLGTSPLGSAPLTEITNAQVTQTTEAIFRFASKTFTTGPTDSPAHTTIDGRLGGSGSIRLSRKISTEEKGQFGSLIETQRGEIELRNNDGKLDYLAKKYAADGRPIILYIGGTQVDSYGKSIPKPFTTFKKVYTSVAGPWHFERGVLRLRIQSLSNRLQNRIQSSVYSGTGGLEGTAEIAGKTRPLTFGRCFNVSPQLVDPALLIYQLHSGGIDSIEQIYDMGATGFTLTTDYASYAELEAAASDLQIPAGSYATCIAAGSFALGVAPVGQVTADLRGDIDNVNGTYSGRHASISRMILRDYADFTSSELDLDSFTAFNDQQPSEIGLFLPAGDQSTVLDILKTIAFSGGAIIGDRSGLYRIQRLDPPSSTQVHWAFTDRDIKEIEQIDLPYGVPWNSWGVRYGVNWTPQKDSDLALSVSQSRRQFLQNAGRYAYSQSSNIALFHRSSSGAPLRESLIVSQENAQAEADRLLAFYNYGRALYRVTLKTVLFSVEIGQTVRITDKRWGLSGGQNFVVVQIDDDAANVRTDLTVFG